MNVSVILPTRNRSEACSQSINSLLDLCNSVNNFEILLAIDEDDTEHHDFLLKKYESFKNIKFNVFKRFYYKGFHNYVNELSLLSNGEFLFLWNDDCIMKSKNWDLEISNFKNKFVVLNPLVENMANYCRNNHQILFPIIPRKWIELTGRWSNNAACDTWIQDISRDLGLSIYIDSIIISHDRFDVNGKNGDAVFNETRKDISEFIRDDFYSQKQYSERAKDLDLIKNYLNNGKN